MHPFHAEPMQTCIHSGARMPSFGPLFRVNPWAKSWPQAGLSSRSFPRRRESSERRGGMMSPRRARRPRRLTSIDFPIADLSNQRRQDSPNEFTFFPPSRSSRTSWSPNLRPCSPPADERRDQRQGLSRSHRGTERPAHEIETMVMDGAVHNPAAASFSLRAAVPPCLRCVRRSLTFLNS